MTKIYCSANFGTKSNLISLALVSEYGDMFYAEIKNDDLILGKVQQIYIDIDKSSLCFLNHNLYQYSSHIYMNEKETYNIFIKNDSTQVLTFIQKWITKFNEILLITDMPKNAFFTNISFNYKQVRPNNEIVTNTLSYMCQKYFESICGKKENNSMVRTLKIMNNDSL